MFIFLHGFNSSSASAKAQHMARHMARLGRDAEFRAPDLSGDPLVAIAQVRELARGAGPGALTLVGSSLGGFYATVVAEEFDCKAVLVNPAVHPHVLLREDLGVQTNFNSGEEWVFTQDHLVALEAMAVIPTFPSRYLLMLQTGDEVLDYHDALEFYAGANLVLLNGGDHGFVAFEHWIEPILHF